MRALSSSFSVALELFLSREQPIIDVIATFFNTEGKGGGGVLSKQLCIRLQYAVFCENEPGS